MKKYYFITYKGIRRDSDPSESLWQTVIDVSPMEFIDRLMRSENEAHESEDRKSFYMEFIVLNTQEISVGEFKKYDGHF